EAHRAPAQLGAIARARDALARGAGTEGRGHRHRADDPSLREAPTGEVAPVADEHRVAVAGDAELEGHRLDGVRRRRLIVREDLDALVADEPRVADAEGDVRAEAHHGVDL